MKLCIRILRVWIGISQVLLGRLHFIISFLYCVPFYLLHQKSLHRYLRIQIENMRTLHDAK